MSAAAEDLTIWFFLIFDHSFRLLRVAYTEFVMYIYRMSQIYSTGQVLVVDGGAILV